MARAEKAVDAAIEAAAKGFWWAEGGNDEDAMHELLHKIGRWRRRNLGCHLPYDGMQYHRQCLVDLAHLRLGMSIGFIANRICSICDEDLSECPHLRGRSYWVRGGPGGSRAECRVCRQKSCSHRCDRLYRAPVIAVVTEGEIREVSIVNRPANPEARLTDVSVSVADLATGLDSHFIPGVTVSCDKCLGDCPGFVRHEDDRQ